MKIISAFQKIFYTTLFATVIQLLCISYAHADVVINEFMASNNLTIVDENGDADDWVELYNTGATPVDIGGWFMSDSLAEPTLSQIPFGDAATVIPGNGFLILWFDKEPAQGPLHVNAKLGSGGEDIVLFDGTNIVDSVTFGPQTEDVSEGRLPDGSGAFVAQGIATPAQANDSTPPATDVEVVEFSIPGGLFTSATSVSLSTQTPGAQIYYTTDGSEPDETDTLYGGSINLSSSTAIRARAFANGLNASPLSANTYLFNVNHDFMILSTMAEPDEIDEMFELFEEDIEINASLEIFETDGTQVINQMVETEIQGTASAGYRQKSLAYKAKGSLGDEDFSYAFFENKDLDAYKSLIGRNSGQDFNMSMFRDAMVTGFVRDVRDVDGMIIRPDLDMQEYRPAVTYLNGEYYGITNLRERIDRRYIDANFGLDRDSIDLLEKQDEIKEGDLVAWDALLDFIRNSDLSQPANFDQLAELIDINNFIDYNAFNVIINNNDWPGNNTRRWRERVTDGKWRWLNYDLDFSFGLHNPGGEWNSGNPTANALNRLMSENGFSHPAPDWSTELFRAAMTNTGFRDAFVNRMADQMNVLFTNDRMLNSLDTFYNIYTTGANERKQHSDRFSSGYNKKIDQTVVSMTTFIQGNGEDFPEGRIPIMIQHIVDQFADVDGAAELTFTSNPAGAGTIGINTVSLDASKQPWSGTYYNGITVPVSATGNRGYFFSGWSDSNMPAAANSSVTPNGNSTITANFTLGSTSSAGIVISEINYNSADATDSGDWVELHNPTANTVDISGWYFEDESGDYFGLPQNTSIAAGGYLLLVADATLFTNQFPAVLNYIGNFGEDPGGFGLSGKGERVSLSNAAGQLIDEVDFDDKTPWPESPDGNGDTLQLLDVTLDNNLAGSWLGELASPGVANSVNLGPAQTITFSALSDKTVIDGSFTLNASADSNLPVSYTITGPASISGNSVTLNGTVGLVTITASQAGNATFDTAADVSQSFNVTLAANTIDFTAIGNKVATDAPFTLSATASSGLPVDINVISGPVTLVGNTLTITGTGGVVLVANQAGNSQFEAATSVTMTFMITLADNVVSFPALSDQLPSAAPFTLNATSSSGLPVSYTVVSGPATINSNTVTLTGATGTVVIAANQSGNNLYAAATSIQQSFDVGMLGNVISFGSLSDKLITDADFTLNATASSGLPVSFSMVSGPASITGNTVSLTGAGTVTIAANQAGNTDFAAADEVQQSFNVNLLPNVISFAAISDVLEDTAPFSVSAISSSSLPVSLSIVSGPATISDNTITLTGSSGVVVVAATQAGNSQTVAASTVQRSFNVNPVIIGPITYCDAKANRPWNRWISGVELADLNHQLPKKNQYGDYTDEIANVEKGGDYDVTLTTSLSWVSETLHYKVWIDYNRNGIFEASETAMYVVNPETMMGAPTDIATATISIPASAVNGETRMRVSLAANEEPTPCGVHDDGEVSDFTVNITGAVGPVATISCPADVNVDVLEPLTTATASWAAATGTTTCPTGSTTVTQTGGSSSGSSFGLGSELISYQVSDACGNIESCSFSVNITQIPVSLSFESCPGDVNVTAPLGVSTAIASWTAPTVDSNCPNGSGVITQTAGLASGASFPAGITAVEFSASDSCGNSASCSFNVNVSQQAVILSINNTPGNTNVATAPGGSTAVATWSAPTVSTNCPVGSASLSQTSGLTSGSDFPVGTTSIEYTATDGCGNTETSSFSVNVTATPVGPISYCDAQANRPWNAWISALVMSDLTHTSGKDRYGDYTDESVTLNTGELTAFTLTTSLSWIQETLHYKIWIDYNQNGVFEEGSETAVYQVNSETILGAPTDIVSSNFTVPATALSGSTRMRISMAWNEEPTPCGVHESGEVNDFTVTIGNSSETGTNTSSSNNGGGTDPGLNTGICASDNHMFVFAGQSNMQGQGDADLAPATDPSQIFEYKIKSRSVVPFEERSGEWWGPDGPDDIVLAKARTGSLLGAFANTYTDLTGKKLTAISTTRGGAGWVYDSGFDHWQPGSVTMTAALAKIDAAIADTNLLITGIVLQGGETDVGQSFGNSFDRELFKAGMRDKIRVFYNRYSAPLYYLLPGNFGLTANPGNDAKADDTRAAMLEVFAEPEFTDYVRVVHDTAKNMRGLTYMQDDGIHYNQAGLDKLGEEAAQALVANQICD